MKNLGFLAALAVSLIVEIIVLHYVKKYSSRNNNQLVKAFRATIFCMVGWCIGLIMQIFIIDFISEDYAIYVDYFLVYPFSSIMPIVLFFFAYIFKNNHITFKKWHMALFIAPIISIIMLWTNDYHHLFYEYYSTNISLTKFGAFFTYFYTPYSYITLAIDIFILIKASIKKTSFWSIQTLLVTISVMVPVLTSIVTTFNILPSTIYSTPISFSVCSIILRNCNI